MSLKTLPLPISRTGGCTLTGALAVTTSVTDSITLIHGPDGCAHHNFSLLHATLLDNGNVRIPNIMSSGLNEGDVIFGGESSLAKAIARASDERPAIIFVLSTCITDTIGDDVLGVCGNSDAEICYIPTSGFFGGQFEDGFTNALNTIARLISRENSRQSGKKTGQGVMVNLIGEKNLEYEVEQNFEEVCRLLSLLGISVNIRFVHEVTVADLSKMPLADLNILREPSLTGVGTVLQELFGIPYLDSFPVGLQGTLGFLRDAGQAVGIDTDHAISREEEYQRSMIADFSDLAGAGVHCLIPGYSPENPVLDEVIGRTGLRHDENGVIIPAPVPQPIGTCGIRRMLHRWRRAIT
jgi:nitrogenase molybdenum-iron protein alpha/beta subunit